MSSASTRSWSTTRHSTVVSFEVEVRHGVGAIFTESRAVMVCDLRRTSDVRFDQAMADLGVL